MSKKFKLPKKAAKEELDFLGNDYTPEQAEVPPAGGAGVPGAAFPIPTTNFRRDFTAQAEELKKKIGLGIAPERVEKPKNNTSLDSKGYLKGEVETTEEPKEKSTTLDLTERAQAVNEGVKKPVFRRKSSAAPKEPVPAEPLLAEQGVSAPVKDERESDDKQPTEAVACETDKPSDDEEKGNCNYRYGPILVPAKDGKGNDEINVYLYYLTKAQRDALDAEDYREGYSDAFLFEQKDPYSPSLIKKKYITSIVVNEDSPNERFISYDEYVKMVTGAGMEEKSSTESFPANESRFPAFNKRERDLMNGGAAAIRRAIASGDIAKVRGHQMLYSLGEPAPESVQVPKSTDLGKVIEQPKAPVKHYTKEERATLDKPESDFNSNIEAVIDSEVGDAYSCDVVYTSKKPYEGQVSRLSKDTADKVKSTFESLGLKTHTIAVKEQYTVLFAEEKPVETSVWYAIVAKDPTNKQKLSQLTLTVSAGATENDVKEYLAGIYGVESVLQVSTTKFN